MHRPSTSFALLILTLAPLLLTACGTRVAPAPPANRVYDSNAY